MSKDDTSESSTTPVPTTEVPVSSAKVDIPAEGTAGPPATDTSTDIDTTATNNNSNSNNKGMSSPPPTSTGTGTTASIEPKSNQSEFGYPNNFVATATAPLSPMHPHYIQQHAYYYQHAPNSPATPSMGNGRYEMGNGGYDVNVQSFLSQQGSNNTFMRQQYPAIPPLSPHDGNNGGGIHGGGDDVHFSMGTVPPASPLFPGTMPMFGEQLDSQGHSGRQPAGSSLQYLSGPPPSPIISYGYPSSIQPGSPEAHSTWTDRSLQQQQMYSTTPTPSPHIQSVQYQQSQSRRTTSFDNGELLPPSALEDSGSAIYATSGGTLFSNQQQPWGYDTGAGPTSPYAPISLQQHAHLGEYATSSLQQHAQMQSPPRARQQGLRAGQQLQVQQLGGPVFYPAATPGPPIQTTQHNKGPEGANLFIFHIPNHFTNLDMWHLFCQYGNLLSVRIMVEKDTGRSRGFGFVSYDAPDAAALAIKELNGFVVGNKRLKVQHKQIRHGEMSMQHEQTSLPPPLFPHGDPVSQGAGYNMPTQEGLAVADVNLPRGLEDQQLDQNQVPNKMLNLDSLGDALPEVDK